MAKRQSEDEALGAAREALARVPPKKFIQERDAQARRLKEAGFRAASAAIKKDRRPTPSVWAVNMLARAEDPALASLLDAGEEVRRTQRRAVSGGGADALRKAQRTFHDAVAQARRAATARLREAKESTTTTVQDRIRDTLLAAATGEGDDQAALREGRLTEDLSPAGFGFVSPLRVLSGGGAPAKDETKAEAAAREAARREREEAEARHQKALEREVAHARAALEQAERKATTLDRMATTAEERARAARKRADDAKAKAQQAREALEQAEAELSRRR